MEYVSMHRGAYIYWCNDDISVHYYAPRLTASLLFPVCFIC